LTPIPLLEIQYGVIEQVDFWSAVQTTLKNTIFRYGGMGAASRFEIVHFAPGKRVF